jgi:hypothetical protein
MNSISFLARRCMYLDPRDEPKGHQALSMSAFPSQQAEVTVTCCADDTPPMDDQHMSMLFDHAR